MSEERKSRSQIFKEAVALLAFITIGVSWIVLFVALLIPSEQGDWFNLTIAITGIVIWLTTGFLKWREYADAPWRDC